jgi:hypothetical protein
MAGTDWRSRAACARRPDLNWFDIDCCLEACLTVCSSCSVRDDCLDEAIRLDVPVEGVWGGLWGYGLHDAKRRRVSGG